LPKNLFTEIQAKNLKKIGINSTVELLLYIPNKYNDQTVIQSIQNTQPGKKSQIEAKVCDIKVRYRPKKNLVLFVSDTSAQMQIRFLHYYSNQIKQFQSADLIRFYGEVRQQSNYKEMIHPEYSLVEESTKLPKNLTPIYSTTKGLSQNMLRKLIKKHIDNSNQNNFFPDLFVKFYKKYDYPSFMDR